MPYPPESKLCQVMAGRTRKKTTAAQQKPTPKRTAYTRLRERSEITRAQQCYFKLLPNEIVVMIIGCLNLFDLVNMLCVSKWINV